MTIFQNITVTQHSKPNATLLSIVLGCRESMLCIIGNCNCKTVSGLVGMEVGVIRKVFNASTLTTSFWKEYITDRKGVVIIRGNKIVDGPRKSRYGEHYEHDRTYLHWKRYVHLNLCVT